MRNNTDYIRLADIFPTAVAFGLFVFWLLALPMEGPLLVHSAADRHIFLFLLPHVASLFLIGRLWPRDSFPRASRLAVPVTIGLTAAFPLFPAGESWLLAACGISGAFVSIRAGLLLGQCRHPLHAAVAGLLLGNLLLFLLPRLTLPQPAGHLLAAAALITLLTPVTPSSGGTTGELPRYLPAIFIFQLVSGLMYRFLMPAYADLAYWSGAELAFYLAAAGLALLVLRRDRELLLVLGVVLGLAAFLCLRSSSWVAINLAMFGMQGAAGCIDMFLICTMLGGSNLQRSFGTGNAVLCSGILTGAAVNLLFGNLTGPAIVVSQVALNGAVLILYLQNRLPVALSPSDPLPVTADPLYALPPLHPDIQALLSEQEQQVLELVRSGKTYREIAGMLAISESSVKTYMTRICGKLGATNKRALLRLLAEKHFPALTAKKS